ncbi:MAG TPA: restriction endonuclease subunit S [Dehalococcoidia bacterium]|nr:restriction endonuclease subunit S [Dehalococcoidia bacterium]
MPGDAPEGWKHLRVGEIARVVGGTTPSSNEPGHWDGDIPFVTPTDLTALRGRYLAKTERCISERGRLAAGIEVLPPRSVLLATRASIGLAAINEVPLVTNQGFQNLVPLAWTDPLWLFYAVSAMRAEFERLAAGTTFRELSRRSLQAVKLLVPPLPEQRAIAAVLDAIDEAIERTQAVIEATETLRRALLHDLLTRGVPGWHKEWKHVPGIGTIPACWEVACLADLVKVNTDGWNPGDTEEILYVDLAAVSAPGDLAPPRKLPSAEAPSRARRRVKPGDILVSTVRPYLRAFARWTGPALPNLVASTGFAVLSPNRPEDSAFVFHVIMTDRFLGHLEPRMTGSGYPAVRPDDVAAFSLGIPGAKERQLIGGLIDVLWDVNQNTKKHVEELHVVKRAIADALLTGRIRIKQLHEAAK